MLVFTVWCPQKYNGNKVHHLARGRLLGGSSAVNFMAYVRPSAEDIDSWATQAPGWSWNTLEPYYHKSESLQSDRLSTHRPQYFAQDLKFHGQSGPVKLSWPPSPACIDPMVVEALKEVAGPFESKDPYGGDHLGIAQYLSTVDRRDNKVTRSDAATAYLELCQDRPNLHILTEATACRVELDETVRARGVRFLHATGEHVVTAEYEVILSASSIQSPRLLELSGIGNPSILQAAGVPCIVELPEVGENLQEHPMGVVTYELAKSTEHVTLDSLFSDPDVLQANLKRLQQTQDGLLAGCTGLIAFVPVAGLVSEEQLDSTIEGISKSQQTLPNGYQQEQIGRMKRLLRDRRAPAIEIIGMPCNFDIVRGYNDQSRLLTGPPAGYADCYSLLASPMYTMSRGRTHIRACGNEVDARMLPPEIDLALLSHTADVDILAASLLAADRAFHSQHLAKRVLRRVMPPPHIDLEDEVQIRQHIRGHVMIFNHNLGSCAMGRVVDERLRVKGVAGLRVVDCSVIPDQISANTMATVYALAERAADLIREDYGDMS